MREREQKGEQKSMKAGTRIVITVVRTRQNNIETLGKMFVNNTVEFIA